MRYPPDHKKKARAAILQAGADALRADGFNGIGVDGLASAAGVTSGAFYAHFANKRALLEDVIESNLGEPFLSSTAERPEELVGHLRAWLVQYISSDHRANPAAGCVMPSLSTDVARAGSAVRDIYGQKMQALLAKIALALGGPSKKNDQRARSIVAIMVGAISISRAMPDGQDADKVIESALATALSLVE